VTLYERAEIVAANAAGFSAATIAVRLGVSRSFVLAVLRARSPESDL
jgi:IS30 family transposase